MVTEGVLTEKEGCRGKNSYGSKKDQNSHPWNVSREHEHEGQGT